MATVGVSSGKDTEEIRRRAKGDNTYKAYKGFANRFKNWLGSASTPAAYNHFVILNDDVFKCFKLPIPDEIIDAYYGHISKDPATGLMRAITTPDGFHASLVHMHNVQIVPMPKSTADNWTTYRLGYGNIKQDEIESKGLAYYEGKDILPNSGFVALQKTFP